MKTDETDGGRLGVIGQRVVLVFEGQVCEELDSLDAG